jgi:hypothetical protein
MAIQRNSPEIVKLAGESVPKLCGFVLDQSLPVDIRIDAVGVIEKLGDSRSAALLVPALSEERSPKLLEGIGKVLHQFNIFPDEAKTAVDYLAEALHEQKKGSYELYDYIVAIGWFQDQRVADILVSQLDDTLEANRREALKGLGVRKGVTAIPEIVKQLREGSSQCVSAAAAALYAIGPEGQKELGNEENYQYVLKKAEQSPRYAIKALNYFTLDRVNDDLLRFFKTTGEYEAIEPLARGLAERGREEIIPELVSLGLDRYKGGERSGRFYIMIFRSIARTHSEGPDAGILNEVKEILSRGEKDDILEFARDLERDAKYAELHEPAGKEEVSEQKYAELFVASMKDRGPEAEFLARAMFDREKDTP